MWVRWPLRVLSLPPRSSSEIVLHADMRDAIGTDIIGVSMARASARRAAQRLARAQKGAVHSWAQHPSSSEGRGATGSKMRASGHQLRRIPAEIDGITHPRPMDRITAEATARIMYTLMSAPKPKLGEPGYVDPNDDPNAGDSRGRRQKKVEAPSAIESIAADADSAAGEQIRICMTAMAALMKGDLGMRLQVWKFKLKAERIQAQEEAVKEQNLPEKSKKKGRKQSLLQEGEAPPRKICL